MTPRLRRFAEKTTVPADKSRNELEALLIRHGATGFLSGWAENKAFVQFMLKGRMLRYHIVKPGDCAAEKAEQEYRRRWRGLLLIVKAKLETVASGDSTFDHEFLADIMLPEGGTVGQVLIPQLAEAYKVGTMPRLLGSGT